MDNLKSTGIKAFIWNLTGKLARHGTSFIVTIFLARLLDPSAFGLIAIVMMIVMVAMVFTDVGLGGALIQRRRILPIHYSSVFYFNIFVGAVLTLITFLSADWISSFFHNPKLIPLIQAVAFLYLINSFSAVQTNKFKKEINFKALTKSDVLSSVFSGIIGVALAFLGAGVWSLVAQVLLKSIFYNIIIWHLSDWSPTLNFSFKALRQLWKFGFHMFLSSLLETIFSRLDVLIIGKLFSSATLGFFDQAKRLNNLVTQYSSGSLMSVLFPILSKLQNDLPRFQNTSIKILELISFVVFFLIGGLYLVSEELIVFLFSDKWLPSVDYFRILMLSGFGYPVSALLVNILKGHGNSKDFFILEIYKKIMTLANFYIGFMFGIKGYLYGKVIVTFLGVSLNIFYASKEIKLATKAFFKPILLQMGISLLSVSFVLLIIFYLPIDNLLISFLFKGFTFFFFYILFNAILKTDSYENFRRQILHLKNLGVQYVKK
ncbi:lipopolysaccharide biosynthesis protein [Hydrogenimonas urashimensis]|uniref:lipopolysaccharide biosynthesis protein n=1 Tax=Hydrogenimonas urashimensis TaxID=2740515 RepID=UPI0019169511|nr:lipopolysaccharide biosynthesis protein [Hydrogenimonas urashimensis]